MIALLVAVAVAATPVAVGDAERRAVKVTTHYGVHHHKTKRACRRHGDRHCRGHVHRRRVRPPEAPQPAPPQPAPSPAPTPTPTPAPSLPSRTSVDLTDDDANGWAVVPAYRTLRAGEVEFNANNLGMDDHDFSVRDAGGKVLANEAVLTGQSVTVRLSLTPAVYTLYCSISDHETRGMRADVTIR